MTKVRWFHKLIGTIIASALLTWVIYLFILGIKKLIGLF